MVLKSAQVKARAGTYLFWTAFAAAAAAVVLLPAWLLIPRSLAGLVDTSAPVELYIQRFDREDVDMTIAPGTPEMAALQGVLDRHTYHLHWTALFGSTEAQSYVSDTYRILYDFVRLRSDGGENWQFGGELTWFRKYAPGDPCEKKSRVLVLDYFGKTEGPCSGRSCWRRWTSNKEEAL